MWCWMVEIVWVWWGEWMGSDGWCHGGRRLWVSRFLPLWVWVFILKFFWFGSVWGVMLDGWLVEFIYVSFWKKKKHRVGNFRSQFWQNRCKGCLLFSVFWVFLGKRSLQLIGIEGWFSLQEGSFVAKMIERKSERNLSEQNCIFFCFYFWMLCKFFSPNETGFGFGKWIQIWFHFSVCFLNTRSCISFDTGLSLRVSEWGGVYVLGKKERKWRNREQDELEIVLDESWESTNGKTRC